MKTKLKIVALFLAPFALISWMYALTKLLIYFWEWPPVTAIYMAIVVTTIQIGFVYTARDIGFINFEKEKRNDA